MGSTTSRKRWIIGVGLLSAIIVAVVVGSVVGTKNSRNNDNNSLVGVASSSSVSSISSASNQAKATSTQTSNSTPLSPASPPLPSAVPATQFVAQRRWDWSKDKAIGICLGNWLVLERWMDEQYWLDLGAGDVAYDQWNLTIALGSKAAETFNQHYSTWIVESDIETLFNSGINILRIPIPFWAFIPSVNEPYVNNGDIIAQLTRVMGYVSKRGMYINLDLHALPGSQNGEESSGRNSTTPSWFGNSVNQARSDALVQSVANFIATSRFRSSVASIEVINEPRAYTDEQNQELIDYYTRSYATLQNSVYPVAMLFTHGSFGTYPFMERFSAFAQSYSTTPPSLILVQHPYPGSFPLQTDQADMLAQVCTALNVYVNFPVPIVISEWSVYTGVTDLNFEKSFYEAQASAWAHVAGGMFWSYKLNPSALQKSAGLNYLGWSWSNLRNSSPTGNTTTIAGQQIYLKSLTSNCVAPPGLAPNPVSNTVWAGLAKQEAAGSA